MAITLTDQQLESLDKADESPARVVNPRTNEEFVLVPVPTYEQVREVLEEDERQASIRQRARLNAMIRMGDEP